jgi:hypothetical protein
MPVRPRAFWISLFQRSEALAKTILDESKGKKSWDKVYYTAIKSENLPLIFAVDRIPHSTPKDCWINGRCVPSDDDLPKAAIIDLEFSVDPKKEVERRRYVEVNLATAIVHESVHAMQFASNVLAMDKRELDKQEADRLFKKLSPLFSPNLPVETRKKAVSYYFEPAEMEARAMQYAYLRQLRSDLNIYDLARTHDFHVMPDYMLREMHPAQKAMAHAQGLEFPENV